MNSSINPGFSMAIMNCQSISSKKAAFANFISENSPDIIAGCESWLSPSISTSEVFPAGFTVYRKDRSDGYGGVFVACRNSIISEELNLDSNAEIVACRIDQNESQPLIICSLYRPPDNNLIYMKALCDTLADIAANHPNSPIWIAGDINLPNINWDRNCTSGNTYSVALCKLFLTFIEDYGLTQMVDFPTRRQNILDIFVTNRPSLVTTCKPIPGISDHEAVLITSLLRVNIQSPVKRTVYKWNRADWDELNNSARYFCSIFISDFSIDTPIDQMWNRFKNFCLSILTTIPSKVTNNLSTRPWITPHIKRLSKRKQRLYNIARLSHHQDDWALYYHLKKECQRECRKAYNSYVMSLIDDNNNVSKRMWSYVKSKRTDNCGIPTLRQDEQTFITPKDKAEILNDYFSSVYTSEDVSTIPTLDGINYPNISPVVIHNEGITNLLSNLKEHKARGPDEIPTILLKRLSTSISPALTLIFQASLHQCKIPTEWKTANIVPIFKKGDKSNPGNYRPVSLTCVCSKLLEHVIYSHVFSHLKKYNILSEEQHGFQQNRSCETQLIGTVNDIAENMNESKQTDVILLDFAKAFDKVPHVRLCHKLSYLGINGTLLEWIKSFLTDRTQQVIVNGEKSSRSKVSSGVPQGTVLAPLLFLCFINDIVKNISSSIKLYADDVLIYRRINSDEDCKLLQRDLIILENWAHKWNMCFSPSKCEFLRITNNKDIINFQYHIQNSQIKEVQQAKYLGVTLNNKLTWSDHIQVITKKANSTYGFIRRNFNNCPTKIKSSLYLSLVRPILEYASTVWSPYYANDTHLIEAVQRRAARLAVNCYSRYQSVTSILEQLDWPTLQERRDQMKMIMMYKIVHGLVFIQHNLPLTPSNLNNISRGHSNRFIQPSTRVDSYKHSFFPSTIRMWNRLPNYVILSDTLSQFKNNLCNHIR